ncbi:hypothetical protein [Nocardia sp. CC227C]|uniref:hypothetical protein n=1 Tax=Nocardia sp. CC227C TaxID=3044562 RepID=UPI00278C7EF7|nr:hypothetical protein [Nocardia sp. CC227C]
MTTPHTPATPAAVPAPVALRVVYLAKHFGSGDQFLIYAPTTDGPDAMYTVAHLRSTSTGIATPVVCQVPHADLAGYAAGAVRILRKLHTGSEVVICINAAPWPLAAALPR